MMKLVFLFLDFFSRGVNKLLIEPGMKARLKHCGVHVKIARDCELKPLENISVGSWVEIGPRALFWTTRAKIVLGNHIIFGPGVTIITGDHPTNVVGKNIMDISDGEKPPECDQDIVIEDDVWVGCNVTILKGVRIGKGAVIAAGSVVTKDVPKYTIVGGVPAKVLKPRFTEEELRRHIQKMGNQ